MESLGEAASRAPREITGANPTGSGITVTSPLLRQPFLVMPLKQRHEPGLVAILTTTPGMPPPIQEEGLDALAPQALFARERRTNPPPSLGILRSCLPRKGDHPQGDAANPEVKVVKGAEQGHGGPEQRNKEVQNGSGGPGSHRGPLLETKETKAAGFLQSKNSPTDFRNQGRKDSLAPNIIADRSTKAREGQVVRVPRR